MPEDQSYNGARWTEEMSCLLRSLNWEFVGDSDFDVPTEDDVNRGIDRLFEYENPVMQRSELCILECKSYLFKSFSRGDIQTWANTLESKLSKIKNSSKFFELFPHLEGKTLNQGIIAVWCPEKDNVDKFNEVFKRGLDTASITNRYSLVMNKLYFIDNEKIMQLVSMLSAIRDINSETLMRPFNFYYKGNEKYPSCRSITLLPSSLVNKFILGDFIDEYNIENKVVFYFGKLTIPSFMLLRSALANLSFTDKDKPLNIFYLLPDTNRDFRKIEPEITKIFNGLTFNLVKLDQFNQIPSFIKNIDKK